MSWRFSRAVRLCIIICSRWNKGAILILLYYRERGLRLTLPYVFL